MHLMHYIAPIPIMIGAIGVIFGWFWLIAVGSDEDGGPSKGMHMLFGRSSRIGWSRLYWPTQ